MIRKPHALSNKSLKKLALESGLFDPAYYLTNFKSFPDNCDPLAHYFDCGAKYLLAPSQEFDPVQYINSYPEILGSGFDPFSHYLLMGREEGRKIFPIGSCNLKQFPDIYGTKFLGVQFRHKRAAIFAAHPYNGIVDDALVYTLESLNEICDTIIFISDICLAATEILKIRHLLGGYICTSHDKGYVQSYLHGLKLIAEKNILPKIKELIFSNDFTLAPINNFAELLQASLEPAPEEKAPPEVFMVFNENSICDMPASFCLTRGKRLPASDYKQYLSTIFHGSLQADSASSFNNFAMSHNVKKISGKYFLVNPLKYGELLAKFEPTEDNFDEIYKEICKFPKTFTTNLNDLKKSNKSIYNIIHNSTIAGKFSTESPGISIILPVFANSFQLMKSIKSIVTQDYNKYELIIIDNCLNGHIEDELKYRFTEDVTDGRIIYIKNGLQKSSAFARMQGAMAARYEWCLQLSADVKLGELFLARLALLIASLPLAEIFYIQTKNSEKLVFAEVNSSCVSLPITGLLHKTRTAHTLEFPDDMDIWTQERAFAQLLMDNCTPLNPKNLYLKPNPADIYIDPAIFKEQLYNKVINQDLTISIIVPTFNCENFLVEAVESILMQDGSFHTEIIIADCGSNDGTRQIAAAYENRLANVQVLADRWSPGFSTGIRRAIEIAKGDFICFLAGHDYWCDPCKLADQVNFLLRERECRMAFSACYLLDQKFLSMQELKILADLPQKINVAELLRHRQFVPIFSGMICHGNTLKAFPVLLDETMFSEFLVAAFFSNFGPIGFLPQVQTVCRVRTDMPCNQADKTTILARAIHLRRIARNLLPIESREINDTSTAEIEKDLRLIIGPQWKRNRII